MKIKDVMEIQRFFILSVISYKSYSDTSISWCWELGILEFCNQYDHFEVQHAYIVKKIKEVMSIQTFFY